MTTCTVLVAYRELMLAEGIAAALARFPGVVPTRAVSTPNDAVRLGERFDAAVVDAELRGAEWVATVLRSRGVRVVFVGRGRVERDERDPDGHVSPHAPVASLAAALNPGGSVSAHPARLTAREREVLSLVATGLAGKQVARRLGISPKTVEHHKTRIFSKLSVPNAAAAVSMLGLPSRGGSVA